MITLKIVASIVAIVMLSASPGVHASGYCGELKNAFGPFDYTSGIGRTNLPPVEQHHFTTEVEMLVKGQSGSVGADLDYTLRAFPNHHRALAAMVNLGQKEKTAHPNGAKYSVECYFDRAFRFAPNDGVLHLVYGNYLMKRGQAEKALTHLNEAIRLQPENANVNYNVGLAYFKRGDFEQANKYAAKAYSLGFPLPWLKEKLIEAGKWKAAPDR